MSKEEKRSENKTIFEEKPLIEHLRELLIRLRRIIIYLISFTAIYFFIGISYIEVNGQEIPIPIPDLYNSLSIMLVRYLITTTVPQGLKLINIGFMDTIISSLYVSIYFGFITSFPLILREIWAFIAPGLYEHEKKMLRNLLLPSILLFVLGSLFAYYIIVPLMLKFLYYYTIAFQVEPTLSIRSFIGTIISLMIGTGIAFQLPLF
ncbi:MAG: twin-arginine translocase subunit TatC, partial [Sulfolobaceae archaeon]